MSDETIMKGKFKMAKRFKSEMMRAKTFYDLGENMNYWRGYTRGLRKAHHENFGSAALHNQWRALVNDIDWGRRELGKGYRDGIRTMTKK